MPASRAPTSAFARAAVPTSEAKDLAWQSVVEEGDLPNAVQESIIGGFARVHEPDLLRPYVDRYFAAVGPVWEKRTSEMAANIVIGLYPALIVEPEVAAVGVEPLDAVLPHVPVPDGDAGHPLGGQQLVLTGAQSLDGRSLLRRPVHGVDDPPAGNRANRQWLLAQHASALRERGQHQRLVRVFG